MMGLANPHMRVREVEARAALVDRCGSGKLTSSLGGFGARTARPSHHQKTILQAFFQLKIDHVHLYILILRIVKIYLISLDHSESKSGPHN